MEEEKIYNKAVELWGKQFQTDMMIEEASELIKIILKERRGKVFISEIIEEMVDCQIMLNQMKMIYNDDAMWNRLMTHKLSRLQELIESDDNY